MGGWENWAKVEWREERRTWSMEETGKAVVGGMPPMGAWGSWGEMQGSHRWEFRD